MKEIRGLDREMIHAVLMHIEDDRIREELILLHVEGRILRHVPTAKVNRAFIDAYRLYKRMNKARLQ